MSTTEKPASRKRSWLSAPPPAPRLDDAEVTRRYPRLRLQVFLGIFLGYAGFYLIRNNISLVSAILLDEGRIDKVATRLT